MKEGVIHEQRVVVAHDQTPKISQPGKGAFDFPTTAVSTQHTAILGRGLASVLAVRTDQLDAASMQSLSQGIAVVGPVGDESSRFGLGAAPAGTRYAHLQECALHQGHFRRRRSVQVVSQRNTLAVDHHHPLRALAPLGFSDAVAPFLAEAKLPSMKLSLQSSWLRRSNSARNCRHTLSQTSCSSHRRKRRQHVAGLTPKSGGRSRQRAPVLSTQRMPSITARLSFHGRPALEYRGRRSSSLVHWESDNMGFAIPSFSRIFCKSTSTKYLHAMNL